MPQGSSDAGDEQLTCKTAALWHCEKNGFETFPFHDMLDAYMIPSRPLHPNSVRIRRGQPRIRKTKI
jgi:hypothetical protein